MQTYLFFLSKIMKGQKIVTVGLDKKEEGYLSVFQSDLVNFGFLLREDLFPDFTSMKDLNVFT